MDSMNGGRFDLNLVVIGKSGAGKSSFCNYLFDKPDQFATGKGKPVTGWEDNFANFRFERDGFSFNVFDSVGLEADNLSDWKRRFRQFLQERPVHKDVPSPGSPGLWIHGFFYVLNASTARIEPAEIALIQEAATYGAPIMVVLTNCDAAAGKVADLRKAIGDTLPGLPIHEVCSVEVRRRSGLAQRFGREEVLKDYIEQSSSTLAFNLARLACRNVASAMRDAKSMALARIEASKMSVLSISDLDLDEVMDIATFNTHFESVDFFHEYLAEFGFDDLVERDFHQEIKEALDDSFEDGKQALERRFQSVSDDLEDGGFFEKVAAVFKILGAAVMLKSTVAEVIANMFDNAIRSMTLLEKLFKEQSAPRFLQSTQTPESLGSTAF